MHLILILHARVESRLNLDGVLLLNNNYYYFRVKKSN